MSTESTSAKGPEERQAVSVSGYPAPGSGTTPKILNSHRPSRSNST